MEWSYLTIKILRTGSTEGLQQPGGQHSTAQHSLQSLVFIIWKVKWRKNLSALYSRNLEFAYLIKSERFIVAHRNIQENLGKVLIFKRPPQKGSPKGGGIRSCFFIETLDLMIAQNYLPGGFLDVDGCLVSKQMNRNSCWLYCNNQKIS